LAILTALTLRAVFRLAYRQAEGLLGSIVGLLGLGLRVPDHTTLSRRAATLDVPRPGNTGAGAGGKPLNLLLDSTGLKLCGKGEAGQGSACEARGMPAEGSGCLRSTGRRHAGRGARCLSGVSPQTSPLELAIVIVAISLQNTLTFSSYAWLFSNAKVVRGYVRLRRWFEGAFAIVFAGASLKVLTARLPT